MPTMQQILAEPTTAGLYRVSSRLPVAALRRRIERTGVRSSLLDGDTITDKPALLRACAAALAFPPYFGRNWDALADCLTDLSWLPAPGYAIIYDHPTPLIRHAPADWAVAREIFRDAANYWRNAGKPFVVLLRRAGRYASDLPLLDLRPPPRGHLAPSTFDPA